MSSLNGNPYKSPPDFTNKPEEFLAWADENWDQSTGFFCPRHWMPAAVESRNGMIAQQLLMQRAVQTMPSNYTSVKKRNEWMDEHRPFCCELGDDVMNELWRMVPVVGP